MRGYISIDHEVLTECGWKRASIITKNDLVYSLDGKYYNIFDIDFIQDNTQPLFHIRNERINVFGTHDVCIYNTNKSFSLYDIFLSYDTSSIDEHMLTFNVLRVPSSVNATPILKHCNKNDVDNITLDAIHTGKHVSIHRDLTKVDFNEWYNIYIYSTDVTFDMLSNDSYILMLNNTRGTSTIHFSISQNVPICVRRSNCISWIVLTNK